MVQRHPCKRLACLLPALDLQLAVLERRECSLSSTCMLELESTLMACCTNNDLAALSVTPVQCCLPVLFDTTRLP